MTTPTVSPSDRAVTDVDASPRVVAAVLFVDERSIGVAVQAVSRQVYEVGGVTVVGGGEVGARCAADRGLAHSPTLADLVSGLGSEADYVWSVHGDARPRPDALGALVQEAERNEAAMVGSKILDAADPTRLESVGSATDVFGEPYSGLDPGEVDLEQYDVVRDVAFLSGVSLLVRRDLLRGLGGFDPRLAPVAAGLDLSQRARLAGGRVMMVPSSEVLHLRQCREEVAGWREQAGRMRAMLKAYRWVTLFWAVPAGAVVGLVDGVVRLFLGRIGPLLDYLAAMGWNLVMLLSTLTARRSLAPIRAAGDEELFRYQVSGSIRLRTLATDIGERFGWIIDEEPGVVPDEEPEEEKSPTETFALVGVLVLLLLAARRLWFGAIPAVGFSLPGASDPGSVLASYAGGWNPTGLGSPQSIHPAPATLAAVQFLLGGWSGTQSLVTAAAMVLGALGLSRLLGRLGIGGAGRYLGAAVYVLGPFAGRFASAAYWPGLVALGALPWLVEAVLTPWPEGRRHRVGRIGQLVLSTGLVVGFAPTASLVAVVAAVSGLVVIGRPVRWRSVIVAVVAVVVGADLVAPYLLSIAPAALADPGIGVSVWPPLPMVVVLLVAVVAATLAGPRPRAMVAGWGGAMMALALAVSVTEVAVGEVAVAAVGLGSLGAGVAVGTALSVDTTAPRVRLTGQVVGTLAALAAVVATVVTVPGGRAGFPEDAWSERLAFVGGLDADEGPDRVLLIGPSGSLPGAWRTGDGYAHRLVLGDLPTLDQAWLPSPRAGDEALSGVLAEVNRAADPRPGRRLGEFAIRWIVVLDDAAPAEAFQAQVDLAERPVESGVTVYENLAARPRAETEGGEWVAGRVGASGPAGPDRVRLADNADPGWSPDWERAGWANELSAAEGRVWYRADAAQAWLAAVSALSMVAAAAAAFWGRERS